VTTDVYPLGAVVPLTFNVTDADGNPAAAGTTALTITLPDGTTTQPAVATSEVGVYTCDYLPLTAGRYAARFVTTGDNAGAVEDVFDVTATALGWVTVTEVRAYLGDTSDTDAQLAGALAAEQAAQAAVCVLDPYTADLREALLRRVARNLAARKVPVAQFTSFEGGGTSFRVPQSDPEIARLEGPHRRRLVG